MTRELPKAATAIRDAIRAVLDEHRRSRLWLGTEEDRAEENFRAHVLGRLGRHAPELFEVDPILGVTPLQVEVLTAKWIEGASLERRKADICVLSRKTDSGRYIASTVVELKVSLAQNSDKYQAGPMLRWLNEDLANGAESAIVAVAHVNERRRPRRQRNNFALYSGTAKDSPRFEFIYAGHLEAAD